METEPTPRPSFSRGRRWSAGLNSTLAVAMVLAVVAMANYLSGRHYQRIYASTHTRVELAPQTVNLLNSLTNVVQVSLYYSKEEAFYTDVAELLKEYHTANPKLVVTLVDYDRDPGQAQELKAKYNLGVSTNVVIFDCAGRVKIVDGNALAEYTLEAAPDEPGTVRRKPILFKGEMMFTSALLAVSSSKPFTAYCLQGHGEHLFNDRGITGYSTFTTVLQQNYVQVLPLSILGSNTVPADCDLLIIAGPSQPFSEPELEKLDAWLQQGRRLLALFDARSANRDTGLEAILAKWGVQVGADLVVDPDSLVRGQDIVVSAFSRHPVVNPLLGSGLYLTVPRPIRPLELSGASSDVPRVEGLAYTGVNAYLNSDPTRKPGRLPVIVAVDKPSMKGAIPEGGAARIIVAGDSFFLGNNLIENPANRGFVSLAANWLLDRPLMLQGLGPKPVSEYRLLITRNQSRTLQWILLGAMPGGVLLLGGLVWLRRRR